MPSPPSPMASCDGSNAILAALLIHESRILQVTIFRNMLHKNLSMLDFSLLLPDVVIIADKLDAQLTQTTDAFTKARL